MPSPSLTANTPLIIAFFDGDPEVKLLSNFANTPFKLDGVLYQSVECFWQSLKTENEKARLDIAAITDGLEVKRIGAELRKESNVFTYGDKMYMVGSKEHHFLLERAIRAKVGQNPEVLVCLERTENRVLRHMIKNRFGQWRTGDSPALPARVFEDILTRIRKEILSCSFKDQYESLPPLPRGINEF